MTTRHYQWHLSFFFTFQLFFLKKRPINASGSGVFPTGAATKYYYGATLKFFFLKKKKNERRHSEWRLCTNAPVGLARLHSATGNNALPFVFLNFRFFITLIIKIRIF
jgi:hypothetical protein